MFEMFFTSTVAYFETSGTVASRSSPEIAGTGACLTGSIFMAIVPPVAINTTTGFVWPAITVASKQRAVSIADFTQARMREPPNLQEYLGHEHKPGFWFMRIGNSILTSVQFVEGTFQLFKFLPGIAQLAFRSEALVVGKVFGRLRDQSL